jgi:hypothetical protein
MTTPQILLVIALGIILFLLYYITIIRKPIIIESLPHNIGDKVYFIYSNKLVSGKIYHINIYKSDKIEYLAIHKQGSKYGMKLTEDQIITDPKDKCKLI